MGRFDIAAIRPAPDPYAAAIDTWQVLSGIIQAAHQIPQEQRAPPGSLPLTVIGGFLGAGKTTLLNHLLSAPHGRKIAVLVNDFGRINIDAALIRSRTEDMISLANGCACCSVAGDLTRTLIELAQRTDPPDAIVLEASGLADPRGIAQVALANPALRLDGLLAVVDAETLAERAAESLTRATVLAQLSSADLIVLNKVDLLDSGELDEARTWLAREVPGRPVIDSVQADIPVDVALGIASTRDILAERPAALGHALGFDCCTLTSDALLEAGRAHALLAALPGGLLRAKGFLHCSDDPGHCTVYQRVGSRWSCTRGDPWASEAPHSSLVLIAPAGMLDCRDLQRRLQACRRL